MSTLPAHRLCPACQLPLSPRIQVCPYCKKAVSADAAEVAAGATAYPTAVTSAHAAAAPRPAAPPPPRVSLPVRYTPEELERQRQEEASSSGQAWIHRIIVAAVLFAAFFGYLWWTQSRTELWVVNTSGETLGIYLDGKSVGELPSSLTETDASRLQLSIFRRKHKVEARDAAGTVVDSSEFDAARGAFLFSPKHDPSVCFTLVTDTYGTYEGPAGAEVLPAEQSFWHIDRVVTNWFTHNPAKVTVRKGTKGTFERALRLYPCELARGLPSS
jgi:hypothetical protein